MYYFVTQKTGSEKAYYETHCARDWPHALQMCRTISQYYPSTCQIVALTDDGRVDFLEITQSGDVRVKEPDDDFFTESLQATAS